MAKFCKNCGSQLEEEEKFCAECGNTVETAPMQEAAMPQENVPLQEAAPPPVPPQEATMQQETAMPEEQYAPPPPPMPPQGQYEPVGQPGYPPQGGPAPKKGLSKKILILIIVAAAVAALIVVALVVGKGANSKYEKLDFFEIGPDKIPSVKNVLGEKRSISYFNSDVLFDNEALFVTYKVAENQGNDLNKYTQALVTQYGFRNPDPYNFNAPSGKNIQFAANSVEDGYYIVLTIHFDETGYKFLITRKEGTLIVYEEEEPAEEEPVVEEEEEEEEPADTGPAADEMDLTVSMFLVTGSTVEEVQAEVDSRITVVAQNPDGSFVLRIKKSDQQDLINESKTAAEDLLTEIYRNEFYAGIADIEWNEDFSEINFLVTDEFFDEEGHGLFALLLAGLAGPRVQVFMGMGLDSITTLYITDAASGKLLDSIEAPDGLVALFE